MTACQRWTNRTQSWRRTSEGGFDPSRYGVAAISEQDAREFVIAHHYAGSYPAATARYGLFDLASAALVGAAVLSVPARREVLTAVFPDLEPYRESIELGRFVLLDEVPANAESWFAAECRRLAALAGVRGIVAFSDPVPRHRADGTAIMPGHVGTIYQASNAVYTGRGTPRTLTILPDGSVLSDRAAQKIRSQDRGHEYAERQLVRLGARVPRAGESPATWLAVALDVIGARKIRHPGNHRYAFRLGTTRSGRATVRIAPAGQPYPKRQPVLFDACEVAA